MRIIIFLFLASLAFEQALPQSRADKTVKPSKSEMQSQLNQAKREAQEQITTLEKDIAEARANNEDPETIKSMEAQLTTLKQIAGGVDKMGNLTNTKPRTLPPPKNTEPKYVSPFEPIVLKQPVTAPTKDQAKDQLFWYKGKKVDGNTIVTVNRTLVRYNSTNNSLIIQPDNQVDSPGRGLLVTLSQTSQIRNDFVMGVSSRLNSFFMYPEIQKAYDDFLLFRDRYYEIAKNTIELPNSGEPLEVLHQQLITSMSTLPSPQNAPAPPERPNDLCHCRDDERRQYEIKLSQWREAFFHEENGLLNMIEAIYGDINSAGIRGYNSIASVLNLKADIDKAFDLVLERTIEKVERLKTEYQPSNVHIEDGLVLATMYLQKLVFRTLADTDVPSTQIIKRKAHVTIDQVKDLVVNNTVFTKYVEEQKAALNFNAVFEYRLYESHEMNKKVFRRATNVQKNISDWLDKLDNFNRFVLSMTLDFDYVVSDNDDVLMKAAGRLESDYMIVTLVRDDCGWTLRLKDPDYGDRSGNEEPFQIPFNVQPGRSKFIKKVGTFPYSGPGKMNMIFPVFKINLCPNAFDDKVFLEGLRFSDFDLAAFPHPDYAHEYSTDLFQYVNKMLVMVTGAQDNSSALVSNAFEGIKINFGNTDIATPSTGNATLDKLMMAYLSYQKKSKVLQSVNETTHSGKTVVPFDAQNRNSVLISTMQSLVDPADRDKKYGIKMKSANITITVTHSPL